MVNQQSLLQPYRVLDLSDERGGLCGAILGSMGADVIQIEPPGGSRIRRLPPYRDDDPTNDSSLVWWALGANKRSLTLDIETSAGRELLKQLIASADFLIESFTPGHLERLGLGYQQVKKIKPSLVYVSITPYGQGGVKGEWAASDINLQGAGGHMYLTGDIDRSPVRVGTFAAYWQAGLEAMSSAMIAHHYRRRTGIGQHVDVSMQQCIVWTLLNTTMTWQLLNRQEMRGGAVRKERSNPVFTRLVWECKDGQVLFVPIGGGGGRARAKSYDRLVKWMQSEGFDHPILTERDWNGSDMFNFTQEAYDLVTAEIGEFLKTKTIKELYTRGLKEAILVAPIHTVKDLANSEQLVERGFFVDVPHEELNQLVKYPGAFAKFSEAPLPPRQRAPSLGRHTNEILKELGYDVEELSAMRAAGVI